MRIRKPMTAEQRAWAEELRTRDHSWNAIGKAMGLTGYVVRAELDPEWYAKKLDQQRREYDANTGHVAGVHRGEHRDVVRNPKYDPARDGAPVWDSLSAVVFGDPPIGRRAIDKQQAR